MQVWIDIEALSSDVALRGLEVPLASPVCVSTGSQDPHLGVELLLTVCVIRLLHLDLDVGDVRVAVLFLE